MGGKTTIVFERVRWFSKYANRRGAKSAKSFLATPLVFLALPHIRTSLHVELRECGADLGGGSASLISRVYARSPFLAYGAASNKRIFIHTSKMLCQAKRPGGGSELESRRLGSKLSKILDMNF